MPDNVETPKAPVMTTSEKNEKIELCAACLKNRQVNKDFVFPIASHLFADISTAIEADAFIKKFQESDMSSHIGVTGKGGKGKSSHTHTFVVMIINYFEMLIGITTSTDGVSNHIHTIKIKLDPKIISVDAYTNYQYITAQKGMGNMEEYHNHDFSAELEKIAEDVAPVSIPTATSYYKEITNNSSYKFNDMVGKLNRRQAEITLLKLSQAGDEKITDDIKASIYNKIFIQYPDLTVLDNSFVAEMEISLAAKKKLDPNAKVRNRGDAICPASSPDVSDNKDHFPQNSQAQARNALARVAQYSKAPSWWKGSLQALVQKVRKAVKAKYPTINVTGLSEHLALRFKDGDGIFFMHLMTTNIETAKHDASLYLKEDPKIDIEIIKFTSDEDGNTAFTDLGKIMLYDKTIKTGLYDNASEDDISLAEQDGNGNVMIEILREGNFHHEIYGDFSITKEKMNEIIKNFNDRVLDRDVSFDFNHMPELPAAGWVKRLNTSNKSIGGTNRIVLNAFVELTSKGKEAIQNKEFRYFSSEYTDNFKDKENGKLFGTVLKGGGLTNRPWMPGLAPIQLSETVNDVCLVKSL